MNVIRELNEFDYIGVAIAENLSNIATCVIYLNQKIRPTLQILRVSCRPLQLGSPVKTFEEYWIGFTFLSIWSPSSYLIKST